MLRTLLASLAATHRGFGIPPEVADSAPRQATSARHRHHRYRHVTPTSIVTAAAVTAATMSTSATGTASSIQGVSAAAVAKQDHPSVRYNFWRGHLNPNLLPTAEMQEILQTMAQPSHQERLMTSLQYLKSDRGDPKLLTELKSFLDRHTQSDELPTLSEGWAPSLPTLDMFLTHGVSHGLDILCTTQTEPGDVVLVERPTYFLADAVFKSHGLIVRSLPMKKKRVDGTMPTGEVDVAALTNGLRDGSIHPIPRMIYIIPTHQNPTGHTMPVEDRWELVQLARRYGVLVAADEVYHLLDWRGRGDGDPRRPARMSVLDQHYVAAAPPASDGPFHEQAAADPQAQHRTGCSISVASFTKIFAPGVRCGWIEGPSEIVDSLVDLGYIQSQGGCAPFVGELMRTALEGIQDHVLKNLNAAYKDRSQSLCRILDTEPGIEIANRPLGGFFLWVSFSNLPPGTDASTFAGYCLKRGLKFMPGVRCDSVINDCTSSNVPHDLCKNSARLCFADMDVKDVEEGAKLLLQYFREYTSGSDTYVPR